MDTELLRTFLEVRRTRHFAHAARNLYLTQAAVSARIRQLEGLVGQRLFTRGRNNIQLTTTGHQLVPYAESILAAWDRALLDTAFRESGRSLVVIGCLPSLREIYLDDWLLPLLTARQNWLLQIESLNTAQLVQRIREGSIDLGIVYEPPRAADLWVESLAEFNLLLVSTEETPDLGAGLNGYIYVDWGSSFAVTHDSRLAGSTVPQLKLDTPFLARRILLSHGGSAYLAEPMIRDELASGRLSLVADAPVIERMVFLIGNREHDRGGTLEEIRATLQASASG